jgi:hypothetical protein
MGNVKDSRKNNRTEERIVAGAPIFYFSAAQAR